MSIARLLRRFRRAEAGSASVEFVIVLPGVFLILLLVADVSFILFNRSVAVHAVEDANRMRAVGLLENDPEVRTHVANVMGTVRMSGGKVETSRDGMALTTEATMMASQIDLVGVFTRLVGNPSITVRSDQWLENSSV